VQKQSIAAAECRLDVALKHSKGFLGLKESISYTTS